jgi:hypothetical protein
VKKKTSADLERARDAISWIGDEELDEVKPRSPAAAATLGFFTWGGGLVYTGDHWRGAGLIGALVGWVALADVLVDPIGPLGFVIGGTISALLSFRRAKALRRFVATRRALEEKPPPKALPAPAGPGKHGELVERLRKAAALRAGGVIGDGELRERKVDLLAAAAPAGRAELDELLFELMPLADEGVLDEEDFDFVKRLGGVR